MRRNILASLMSLLLLSSLGAATVAQDADPLPSWNDGDLKTRIVAFVASVTDESGAGFVPEEERIAVFDIDGTLWAERPFYNDALFAADRVKALAADNPDWAGQLPYAPIVAGDYSVVNYIAGVDFIRLLNAAYGGASEV